jgi:hypothetical protein
MLKRQRGRESRDRGEKSSKDTGVERHKRET